MIHYTVVSKSECTNHVEKDMKILATMSVVICVIVLGGCATQPRILPIIGTFDPDEVLFVKQKGDNTIRGQAFMRQRGGGIVTCAGQEVSLIPFGSYSRERINAFYGTISKPATKPFRFGGFGAVLPEAPSDYIELTRNTTCNANGDFTFANIANGSYFITVYVVWYASGSPYAFPEGGILMTPVKVNGGEERHIIMSN